jgi:pimeloyl-ACP methyl ester carboxylesterase
MSPRETLELLDLPEGRLAYEVTGSGPLVVCVPGMGDLRSVYRFTVPALVAAGFRVAAMDLRGHGDSDATFTRYDDVATGEDILALIEHLGGSALVVGNSLGAGAAVWAAAERPGAITGLALIGPYVRDVRTNPALKLAFRALMAGAWAGRAWTAYLPKLYPAKPPVDFSEHRAAIGASLRRPAYRRAFTATTHTTHAPAEARLPRITVPALVVMGTRDPDFPDPTAEAQLVADRLHGEVLLIPNAGHYPQAEFPELVNPGLVAFAERAAIRA